jgi:cysteinyl-tRNA synthetase
MPPLRLWNSLERQQTEVRAQQPDGIVRVYHCGPTVYAMPHIGNLRRFLVADLLVRTLAHLGYTVRSVMNITDVGHLLDTDHEAAGQDRIMLAAERERASPQEIAAKYTQEFFDALTALRAHPAEYYPRATQHIRWMLQLTETLLKNGVAYETPAGIYLDVTKVPAYGKLSGNTLEAITSGARVDVREEKRHPADFALWVKAPREHLMQWDSPWGRGYPGWHIECSAMAMHALGETLDIHTGGEDNRFPHHENEIAQSESATGKPFANIWLHNAHLLVDGKKMSKSEGAFITLHDLFEKGFDPLAFRLLCLQTHYRSKLNFTWGALHAAAEGLKSIRAFVRDLHATEKTDAAGVRSRTDPAWDHERHARAFTDALADDLGSPQALAVVFTIIKEVNPSIQKGTLSPETARDILDLFRQFDRVLALLDVDAPQEADVPAEVAALVEERERARTAKDFARADELRQEIQTHGFTLEDTPAGPRLTPSRAA